MTSSLHETVGAGLPSVSIVGVGYVGAVAAACIARRGFRVIAADVDSQVVERLKAGHAPLAEPGLDALISDGVGRGLLSATTDVAAATADTDMTFLCVGTPGDDAGRIDLRQVTAASTGVGEGLSRKRGRHCVVLRSTVVPGTLRRVVIPSLEAASGLRASRDFAVAYHPEFLREGSAIADHDAPPLAVFGIEDAETADALSRVCGAPPSGAFIVDLETAELVKYGCNAWHATKVAFANELATIAERCGVDGGLLMTMICADRVLNISDAYLRPGLPFGGSCLPKDLRALLGYGRAHDLTLPMLQGVLDSNAVQLDALVEEVCRAQPRRVSILGVAFKPHTDDLRESPMLKLASALIARGIRVRLFDPAVATPLPERSAAYVARSFPSLASCFVADASAAIAGSDVIVLGHSDAALRAILAELDHPRVLDLGCRPPAWVGAARRVVPAARVAEVTPDGQRLVSGAAGTR